MSDSRFLKRKCLLIDFKSFENVMQELLDDRTIIIERDYPVLSCYSPEYDCTYDETEIMERVGDYLGVQITRSVVFFNAEEIFFILS